MPGCRAISDEKLLDPIQRGGRLRNRAAGFEHVARHENDRTAEDVGAALLRHGARVEDKRLTGQGSDGGRATALHYAAKAGFVKTIEVLLDHGADPTARDDNGFTPLDWLERAAPSIDRQAVRRLFHRPLKRSTQ
jgi:Ankyrin repeats (many copies)